MIFEVAVEFTDGVGTGGVAAVGGGDGEVGVAVEVFEVVVTGGVGEARDNGVGGGVVELDDGAAEGLVAGVGDGAADVAYGWGLLGTKGKDAEERRCGKRENVAGERRCCGHGLSLAEKACNERSLGRHIWLDTCLGGSMRECGPGGGWSVWAPVLCGYQLWPRTGWGL